MNIQSIKRNIKWFFESFKSFDLPWKQQCYDNITKGDYKLTLMNKHLAREVINGLDSLSCLVGVQPISYYGLVKVLETKVNNEDSMWIY